MIRVNLLRQPEKVQTGIGATTGVTAGTATNIGRQVRSDLAPKIAGFFAPIVLVYSYNLFKLSQINGQIDDINIQKTKIQSESQSLQPQLAQIAKYKADKDAIQKEIDEIKGLSLGRYRVVKILDTIQTILPQKAWLTSFDLKGDAINLSGNATEDIAISSFIEELDRSLYFKDISWIDSREAVAENGETVKMFKLSFKLENL